MPKPTLQVIVASTRPRRVGPAVADYLVRRIEERGGFEIELLDLAEIDLPLLDEPHHPRLGRYEHAHTKAWSATISRGADNIPVSTQEHEAIIDAVAARDEQRAEALLTEHVLVSRERLHAALGTPNLA